MYQQTSVEICQKVNIFGTEGQEDTVKLKI